jgi:hypothetical protein
MLSKPNVNYIELSNTTLLLNYLYKMLHVFSSYNFTNKDLTNNFDSNTNNNTRFLSDYLLKIEKLITPLEADMCITGLFCPVPIRSEVSSNSTVSVGVPNGQIFTGEIKTKSNKCFAGIIPLYTYYLVSTGIYCNSLLANWVSLTRKKTEEEVNKQVKEQFGNLFITNIFCVQSTNINPIYKDQSNVSAFDSGKYAFTYIFERFKGLPVLILTFMNSYKPSLPMFLVQTEDKRIAFWVPQHKQVINFILNYCNHKINNYSILNTVDDNIVNFVTNPSKINFEIMLGVITDTTNIITDNTEIAIDKINPSLLISINSGNYVLPLGFSQLIEENIDGRKLLGMEVEKEVSPTDLGCLLTLRLNMDMEVYSKNGKVIQSIIPSRLETQQ